MGAFVLGRELGKGAVAEEGLCVEWGCSACRGYRGPGQCGGMLKQCRGVQQPHLCKLCARGHNPDVQWCAANSCTGGNPMK